MKLIRCLVPLLAIALAACGGGGATGSANSAGQSVAVTPMDDPAPAATFRKSYRLAVAGTPGAGSVQGIQFTLSLPAGAVIAYDSSWSVLPESMSLSGQAPADGLLTARYAGSSVEIVVMTATGLGIGEFATLTCQLATGATAPAAGDFVVKDLIAVDFGDQLLPGVSVTLQ